MKRFTAAIMETKQEPTLEFRAMIDDDGYACFQARIVGTEDWSMLCYVDSDTGLLWRGQYTDPELGLPLDGYGRIVLNGSEYD